MACGSGIFRGQVRKPCGIIRRYHTDFDWTTDFYYGLIQTTRIGGNKADEKIERIKRRLLRDDCSNYRGSHFQSRITSIGLVGLVCIVLFEAVPGVFIRMFGSADDPVYFDFAVLCLRIYLSLILVTCVQKVCAIFLQSIGRAKAAAPLSVLRDALLIVFSLLIPVFMGVTGIFWAAPAADVLAIFVTAAVMVRVWKELGREKETQEPAAAAIRPSRKGAVITIAREHGSAGKRIGQMVAEKLDIPCYYKELVAVAAQESGLAQEFISGINSDENAVMRELYLTADPVKRAVAAQEKAIRHIADAGSCVIIGRSADYVLRNYPDVVRIFIYAPESYREKR